MCHARIEEHVLSMLQSINVYAYLVTLEHTVKQTSTNVTVFPVSTMGPVRMETMAITVPVCMDLLDLHVKLVRTFLSLSGPVFGVKGLFRLTSKLTG